MAPILPNNAHILRDIIGNPFCPATLPVGEACGKCHGRKKLLYAKVHKEDFVLRDISLRPNHLPVLEDRECHACHGTGHGPSPVLTPTVLALAQAAYDERQENGTLDNERLMILSDALEDAGCDNEELLMHLRGYEVCRYCMLPSPEQAEYGGGNYWCPGCGGTEPGPRADNQLYPYWMHSPGPHHRGCWALDLILGKE